RKPCQPAFIFADEVCGDQEEKANLKTASINNRQQARNDGARQFVGVREIRGAQHAKEIRRDRGAKEDRSPQPETKQQSPQRLQYRVKNFHTCSIGFSL